MDQSDRDVMRDKAPSWQGRASTTERALAPRFSGFQGSTGWLWNFAVLVALCAAVTALGTEVFRAWAPGIFMSGSPLSSLSPLPAVAPPSPVDQAAARIPARSAVAASLELEQLARQKAQEQNDQRRAAAVKQTETDEAAARRRTELDLRREREWRASYVKPPQCDESLPTVDSVGCANDYIRARRKFDEQFLAANRR